MKTNLGNKLPTSVQLTLGLNTARVTKSSEAGLDKLILVSFGPSGILISATIHRCDRFTFYLALPDPELNRSACCPSAPSVSFGIDSNCVIPCNQINILLSCDKCS